MSSTSSSSTSPTTPRSRPVSLASGLGRQRSLRLPKKPVDAPIPPSLTSSKYLTSPHSIFRRTLSDPHIPSQEDEEWLRDTVPLSREGTDDVLTQEEEKKRSRLSGIIIMVRRTDDIDEALRGRSSERTKALRTATASMSSPPLVRQRLSKFSTSSRATNWVQTNINMTPTRTNASPSWPSPRHD